MLNPKKQGLKKLSFEPYPSWVKRIRPKISGVRKSRVPYCILVVSLNLLRIIFASI
jgi:hypothetical protein